MKLERTTGDPQPITRILDGPPPRSDVRLRPHPYHPGETVRVTRRAKRRRIDSGVEERLIPNPLAVTVDGQHPFVTVPVPPPKPTRSPYHVTPAEEGTGLSVAFTPAEEADVREAARQAREDAWRRKFDRKEPTTE